MKRLACFFLFSLAACGWLGEAPAPLTPYIPEKYQAPCRLPEWETIDLRASEAEMRSWVECGLKQVTEAQSKIRGANPEELTTAELKHLNKLGILGFEIHDDRVWTAVQNLIGIVHPEGASAIQWKTLRTLLDRLQEDIPLVQKVTDPKYRDDGETWVKAARASHRYFDLISDKWSIPLPAAWDVYLLFPDATPRDREKIEAAWVLKSLLFSDPLSEGPRGKLNSRSLKPFLNLVRESVLNSPSTLNWLLKLGRPAAMPSSSATEIDRFFEGVADYFASTTFASVDTKLVQWAARQLERSSFTSSGASDLIPDIARMLQRLAPGLNSYGGINAGALAVVSGSLRPIGAELYEASRLGWDESLSVTRGAALKSRSIQGLSYVLPAQFFSRHEGAIPPLPIQQRISFPETTSSLFTRQIIRTVFSTFDENKDGQISYTATRAEETKEAMDLAYTALRIFSVIHSNVRSVRDTEPVVDYLPIKPSVLSNVLGLIGDRWFPTGNKNGFLEADELSVAMLFHDEIQRSNAFAVVGFRSMVRKEDEHLPLESSRYYYDRKQLIEELPEAFEHSVPWIQTQIRTMGKDSLLRLFDGLMDKPKPRSTLMYPISLSKPREYIEVREPMKKDDILPIAAVLTAMDKLMLSCDINHDTELDWKEMDCALPLATEAGLITLSSNLVSVDAGIFDAARLALAFVGKPGPGLSVLKVAASLGSYRAVEFKDLLQLVGKWIEDNVQLSEADLAGFLQTTEGLLTARTDAEWAALAKSRFGSCDGDHNGFLNKKELTCFADSAVASWLENVMPPMMARLGVLRFSNRDESKILRHVLVLTACGKKSFDWKEFEHLNLPLKSNVPKILSLLGEILDRGQ